MISSGCGGGAGGGIQKVELRLQKSIGVYVLRHPLSKPLAYPGSKVIPGFGIHPWWSHLHASSQGDSWQQLLEAPSEQQLQQALHILSTTDPVTNSGAYATNRPSPPDRSSAGSSAGSSDGSSGSSDDSSGSSDGGLRGLQASSSRQHPDNQEESQQQQQQQQQQGSVCLGEGLRVVPLQEWHGRLRQLLTEMPGAIVGGEA